MINVAEQIYAATGDHFVISTRYDDRRISSHSYLALFVVAALYFRPTLYDRPGYFHL